MALSGGDTLMNESNCNGLDSRRKPWEIRNGKVLFGCLCIKRNGLQSECFRSDCINKKCAQTIDPEVKLKSQNQSDLRPVQSVTQPMSSLQVPQALPQAQSTPLEQIQSPLDSNIRQRGGMSPTEQNYSQPSIQQPVPVLPTSPTQRGIQQNQLGFMQNQPEHNYKQSLQIPNLGNPEGYKPYYRSPRQTEYVKNINELVNSNVNERDTQNLSNLPVKQQKNEPEIQNRDELLQAQAQLNYEQYKQNKVLNDPVPQRQINDDEPRGFPPARPERSKYRTIPINKEIPPQVVQNQYRQSNLAQPHYEGTQYNQNQQNLENLLNYHHPEHFPDQFQNQYLQNQQFYKQNQIKQQHSQVPLFDSSAVHHPCTMHDPQPEVQYNNNVQQNLENQNECNNAHVLQNQYQTMQQYAQPSHNTSNLIARPQNMSPQQTQLVHNTPRPVYESQQPEQSTYNTPRPVQESQQPEQSTYNTPRPVQESRQPEQSAYNTPRPVQESRQPEQSAYNTRRLAAGVQNIQSPKQVQLAYNTPRMEVTHPQNVQSPHITPRYEQQYVHSSRNATEVQNVPETSNQYVNSHVSYNIPPQTYQNPVQITSPQPNQFPGQQIAQQKPFNSFNGQPMSNYYQQSENEEPIVESVAPLNEYPPQAPHRHVGQGEYHRNMRQPNSGYNYYQPKFVPQQNSTQQMYQRGQGEYVLH